MATTVCDVACMLMESTVRNWCDIQYVGLYIVFHFVEVPNILNTTCCQQTRHFFKVISQSSYKLPELYQRRNRSILFNNNIIIMYDIFIFIFYC